MPRQETMRKVVASVSVKELAIARVIETSTRTYENIVLTTFKQVGVLERLGASGFSPISIRELAGETLNEYNLWATLDFLASLGYLTIDDAKTYVALTPLGAEILNRNASSLVPNAYLTLFGRSIILYFKQVLKGKRSLTRHDLLSDIQGSGRQHHAYFDAAASAYQTPGIEAIVDMGMGDGSALVTAATLNRHRALRYVGTDFHEEAVAEGARKLAATGIEATTFQANMAKPEELAGELRKRDINPRRVVVSSFFILEEVIGRDGQGMQELLDRYYEVIGPVFVFGEIYCIDWKVLANGGWPTTVPVYTLIHRLSPQEIISRERTLGIIAASRWKQTGFTPIGKVGGYKKEDYSAGGVHILAANG